MHSPIGAAHALLAERGVGRPLLDLSQAAPSFPPAPVVAARVAEVAGETDGARYAPQPGLPGLRSALAADLSRAYGAEIDGGNVLITAGCNQAFCLVASAVAGPGDEVIVASPFYFNHDMWLRVEGIGVVHLPAEPDHLPDPTRAEALITGRTRAIVLVSPGNPTGVTIPAARVDEFGTLAKRRGLALIVDETYRTYRPTTTPAHALFADPEWTETVVSLHSFSKDLAIPGYRVGALVCGDELMVEALKILDCVAISAPRIGQEAARAGLLHAGAWRVEQAERVAGLQSHFETVMARRPGGFELVSSGAYFGWVRHPFRARSTGQVVADLLTGAGVLTIPGTAFTPGDEHMIRLSFANLTPSEIEELGLRLAELEPGLP